MEVKSITLAWLANVSEYCTFYLAVHLMLLDNQQVVKLHHISAELMVFP